MKNIFLLALVSLFISGCSLWGSKTDTTTKPEKIAATESGIERSGVQKTENYSANDFYFESGQDGLTLKHRYKTDFSSELSTQPIESAEIIEGILLFQEKNGLQAQKTFNLEAIVDSWK